MSQNHNIENNISRPSKSKSAIRKAKARHRLSYLLLDVFLGGFIVGIVLMVTLSRPISNEQAEGKGGEPFVLIEFRWSDPELVLSPILKYNNTAINQNNVGLATPWPSDSTISTKLWLEKNQEDGVIEKEGPYDHIVSDGFDPQNVTQMTSKDVNPYYGYIWMSMSCPGNWSLSIRNIQETHDKQSSKADVEYRIKWSGYGIEQPEQEQNWKSFEPQNKGDAIIGKPDEAYGNLHVTKDSFTKNFTIRKDADLEFKGCPTG